MIPSVCCHVLADRRHLDPSSGSCRALRDVARIAISAVDNLCASCGSVAEELTVIACLNNDNWAKHIAEESLKGWRSLYGST